MKSFSFKLEIILLASFLVLEQAYYGFFIHQHGVWMQQIHFLTALLMFGFVLISVYFKINPPAQIRIFHKIYDATPGCRKRIRSARHRTEE